MTLDLTQITNFFLLPADQIVLRTLINFGWIPVVITILWGAKELWVYYIQDKWGSTINKVILAIDVPRGNEQSLKAVENIFTYFGGAHGTLTLLEKFWLGYYQLSFSFEIVSIDGYTQFLIRSPAHFRNLVESAVYSQYPDAEITEVNDYTEGIPRKYPDEEYDIWGAEFIFTKNDMYPIKTYSEFESTMAGRPETQFKDPMASLMDLSSSLNKGEQLWYQILVTPIGFDWMEKGDKEISKILKEKTTSKKGIFGTIFSEMGGLVNEFFSQIGDFMFGGGNGEKEEDNSLRMLNLKPKEKKQIEAIQEKISKLGFKAKQRMVYVAKKDVMNKPKVVNGFVGYIKQFTDLDLNNFKPDMEVTATSAAYFFKDYRVNSRKNKIINAYINRDGTVGREAKVYNIEELATIWHFPVEAVVKAPLIQKAPGRKAEPPMSLPIGEESVSDELFIEKGVPGKDIFSEALDSDEENIIDLSSREENKKEKKNQAQEDIFSETELETAEEAKKSIPPSNLPVV